MYLIIGATGYLGSYFLKNIIRETDNKVIATNNSTEPNFLDTRIKWKKLDLANFCSIDNLYNELSLIEKKFKIIFLSSYHHPDQVEKNPKLAWHINVASLDYFLYKFEKLIATFYYASSDAVYGESINGYLFNEEDICCPVNTYGRTKFIAEKLVLLWKFNVIRYPFLIGPSLNNKKHFYDSIYNALYLGNNLDMFGDSYRSPLDFNSASQYTIDVIEQYPALFSQVINICSDTPLSKYEIALLIAKNHNFEPKNINKISINDNSIFLAKRPATTLMDNLKIKKILNLEKINLTL
ncbi:Nucleoside-diphosphate-sugar epimerase [Candidatus Hepatincolaceae symbiont of Richtersius coronifer]